MARKLLNVNSSLQSKARGLSLARHYDDPSVNVALVAMLGDKSPGGRVSRDEIVEMPWIEAMHILAKRFPEANVKMNMDYRYSEQDRTAFLEWWSANRERIKYRGNSHILEAVKDTRTEAIETSVHPAPPKHVHDDSSVSAQEPPPIAQPPALKKTPSTEPASEPNEEPASSTTWAIVVVVIVAAIGLLVLLFKRRS